MSVVENESVLSAEGIAFVTVRHLASLTTLRADGTPHVCPVGFTFDASAGLVRVITSGASQKALNVRRGSRMAVCQIDGAQWLTFEGPAAVVDTASEVADACERYAARYRQPRENPARVVLVCQVDRVLGTAAFRLPTG